MLVGVQGSGYKQARVLDAAVHDYLWRPAHDGTPSPRGLLFCYFRLEDQVPENHLLRLIDRHVNFEFIRAKLKNRYSDGAKYTRISRRNTTHVYFSTPKRCRECSQKSCLRQASIGFLPSTLVNRHDSAPTPGPRHRSSRSRNGLGEKKSGGTVRRAKELHRTTPTEATPDALRARAVLPGGHGAEPENGWCDSSAVNQPRRWQLHEPGRKRRKKRITRRLAGTKNPS